MQPLRDSFMSVSKLSEMPRAPAWGLLRIWLLAFSLILLTVSGARAERMPTNCSGSGLGINLFTSIPDVHVGDTLFYSINVFNGIPNSGRIVCDATNITAVIVTPDGLTNHIVLSRTTLHNGESDYYPSVVSYVVRAQDLRSDGTVRATASDIGAIQQNDTDSVGGGDQGVNTEVNLPCVLITAQCLGGVGEKGLIQFTGIVTNCGNNTLVGVTVTNFANNGFLTVLFPTNLAIGQSTTFSGSWMPLNPCVASTATLTVLASDQFTTTPRIVTNFTTITCQNTLVSGIKVTKTCPALPTSPGKALTYSGSVSNTGNVTLTNIVVVNDQPAANTTVFTLASLAPGAIVTFAGSYTAPTNCSVTDTLSARASSVCGVAVSNSATATCAILTTPQITVAALCPAVSVTPGGSLTYSGTVRNSGDIPLTNVIVLANRPATNTTVFQISILAPGAQATFTGTYTVPVNACSVATVFSASGSDICSLKAVTNTVTTTCTVMTAPAISVTLACPSVAVAPGALITYSGTVSNSGNVILNNVTVIDAQSAPSTVLTVLSLAPGASSNFSASFTTPIDSCSVSSSVKAFGSNNCTSIVVSNSASATCSLITSPSIVVTELCPVSAPIAGQLLTYSGTVSNSGNITLTNVVVLNSLSGSTPVLASTTLAPRAVAAFAGSFIAPTNCSVTSTSTATGRSLCGIGVTNWASATCVIVMAPRIAITQYCPAGPIIPGGVITYNGTVSNSGNVTLTNVTVINSQSVPSTVLTVLSLAPGASSNFTASVTAPLDACSVNSFGQSLWQRQLHRIGCQQFRVNHLLSDHLS